MWEITSFLQSWPELGSLMTSWKLFQVILFIPLALWFSAFGRQLSQLVDFLPLDFAAVSKIMGEWLRTLPQILWGFDGREPGSAFETNIFRHLANDDWVAGCPAWYVKGGPFSCFSFFKILFPCPASPLFCFFLLCFFASFRLCFSPSLHLCFYAFVLCHASLLLCFSASVLLCFSAFTFLAS